MERHQIPAKGSVSFFVSAGDRFEIIDPEGQQIADLVAFADDDRSEKLSTEYTLSPARTGKVRISTGDTIYSSAGNQMLTITDDTCGVHDMLFPPCTSWIIEERHGQHGEKGCRELLASALDEEGITETDILTTFNVFMNTTVTDQTYIDIRVPESEPGDAVEFEAEQDLLVAISACPASGSANGFDPTSLAVRLPPGTHVTQG